MSLHIAALKGDIADTILLPGDPLRAKFIAKAYLKDPVMFNDIRNIYGYTGEYKGKRISVMATGMGMPSMAIYSHELIVDYECRNLLRIGTAGSYQSYVKNRDIVLALSASTDSNFTYTYDLPGTFSPCCNFNMAKAVMNSAEQKGIKVHAGNVVSVDVFYDDNPDTWKKWAKMNVLAVEMEAAALYYNAARYGANALGIMTISDNFNTGERLSIEDRKTGLREMIEVALDATLDFE